MKAAVRCGDGKARAWPGLLLFLRFAPALPNYGVAHRFRALNRGPVQL
jgi:hypothetical protein